MRGGSRVGRRAPSRRPSAFLSAALLAFLLAAPAPSAGAEEAGDGLPAAPAPWEEPALPLEILLGLGWGFTASPVAGLWASPPDIVGGPRLDELVERVSIRRAIHERLFLELDYEAQRADAPFAAEPNRYSLLYHGPEGAFLQTLSLGNLYQHIPGDRFTPTDQGGPDSFALRLQAGGDRLRLDGLVRYGLALAGVKRFRGSRQVMETVAADVDHVRGRFFLLPDAGVDEASLLLARTSEGAGDRRIGGRRFDLLARGRDYELDNPGGRLYLAAGLSAGQELLVTYTRGPGAERVGSAALGGQAIIAPDGTRADFSQGAFPEYFTADDGAPLVDEGGTRWLALRRRGLNGYWELRNAYSLEGVGAESVPGELEVRLTDTRRGGLNLSYGELLDRHRLDPARGVLFFELPDGGGLFHPRPFPGERPFSDPLDPVNPFDPQNPVYGGLGAPVPESSVNTLHLRYTLPSDSFHLEADLVPGSVQVRVDGAPLPARSWTVDHSSGLLTFAPGAVSPVSEVEVRYLYTPPGGEGRLLSAALGVGWEDGGLRLRNLLAFELPLADPPAPRPGEERQVRLSDSLEASLELGARPGEEGPGLRLAAGGAAALTGANVRGVARVADMEEDLRIEVGLGEEAWQLASPSALLPAPSHRGELLYRNYRETGLLGGETLHTIGWDNSGNPAFSYAQKAGPYNSADRAEGGGDRSLVLDFSFPAGAAEAFAAVAARLPGEGLPRCSQLNLLLRGAGLDGPVELHVELLRRYEEDLDGDLALDAEERLDQAGLAIVPRFGGPTVLGTDPRGRPDGRLASEDLDGNGYLDSGAEEGVLLATVAPPAGGDWRVVSVDLGALLQAGPRVFQEAKVIRLTVKPAASPTPAVLTGRLLVNRLWFSGPGVRNEAPASLALREVSAREDAAVAGNAFSRAYPQVYDSLHGRESWREKQGGEEKVLRVELTSPLPAGQSAFLAHQFGSPADLSPYRRLRLYLFLPPGQGIPAGAEVAVELQASGSERLSAGLDGSAFRQGWNEIELDLAAPWQARVNGAAAGAGELSGTAALLRRIAALRFGLRAPAASPLAPLHFWLDEWHLADSRSWLDGALFAEAAVGWGGTLRGPWGLPLLTDPALAGSFELRSGWLADRPGQLRRRLGFDGRTGLLELLTVRAGWSRLDDREREGPPAGAGGEPPGRSAESWYHGLELDAGSPFLPVLVHEYHRSLAAEDDLQGSAALSLVRRGLRLAESASLGEVFRHPRGEAGDGEEDPPLRLEQSYTYERSWLYDRLRTLEAGTGLPVSGVPQTESLTLTEVHQGRLELGGRRGSFSAELRLEESRRVEDPGPPLSPLDSWLDRLAGLFRPLEEVLPGGARVSRSDRLQLSAGAPRRGALGFASSARLSWGELNHDPEGAAPGTRDVTLLEELSVELPFRPVAAWRLELVPRLSRSFQGAYGRVAAGLGREQMLAATLPLLLRPAPAWPAFDEPAGRLRDYEAVDRFLGSADIGGAVVQSLRDRRGLEARLESEPWFLPSRLRLEARGETTRSGATYSQSCSQVLGVGKTLSLRPAAGSAGGVSLEGSLELGRDFATRVLTRTWSASAAAFREDGEWNGWSAAPAFTFRRERQADPADLPLVPGDPAAGLPLAARPDRDTLTARLTADWRWSSRAAGRPFRPAAAAGVDRPAGPSVRGPSLGPLPARRTGGGAAGGAVPLRHRESLLAESSRTWTWREPGTTSVDRPLRLTLEHSTRLRRGEALELDLRARLTGGFEERFAGSSRTRFPFLGAELAATAAIRY